MLLLATFAAVYPGFARQRRWQMRPNKRITMTVAAATLAASAMKVGVINSSMIVVLSSTISTSTL